MLLGTADMFRFFRFLKGMHALVWMNAYVASSNFSSNLTVGLGDSLQFGGIVDGQLERAELVKV